MHQNHLVQQPELRQPRIGERSCRVAVAGAHKMACDGDCHADGFGMAFDESHPAVPFDETAVLVDRVSHGERHDACGGGVHDV